MVEKCDFSENTAVIKSSSHMVRVMLNGSETVFSASDILHACGIKYPLRWMDRSRKAHPEELAAEKLGYPMMTSYGYRQIKMVFISAATARNVVNKTPCSSETKEWLIKEVLSYRLNEIAVSGTPVIEESKGSDMESPQEKKVFAYDDSLNRRIDNILIELLELKKVVTEKVALW